jgi:hypothetical protein
MEIETRGTVLDAEQQGPDRRVNAFTGVCRLRSGALLCGFQAGPAKHAPNSTVRLARSRSGGENWEDLGTPLPTVLGGVPGSLASGDMVEPEPGRLLLFTSWFDRSDPERPLYDPSTQGVLHAKQLYAESADEGETWAPWREVPTPGLKGCAATGPPVLWPDGTLAFAFESFKEYDDPAPGHHAAWLAVSRDGGRSFAELHLVARHPDDRIYFWDQRLCPGGRPGRYTALFWTHDLAEQRDITVHLRHGSLSEADPPAGTPRATSIPGQIAAPLWLSDGRLLAFVVDRSRPGTLTLWSSPDAGASWPEADRLIVHSHDERAVLTQGLDNVDFDAYWEDMAKWTFGHPAICGLDDGRVLVAYYAGRPGCLGIHWARIRT